MRLFMHTAKAVKRGHPADRLFVVVSSSSYSGRAKVEHLAWKVSITSAGLIHPAYQPYKKVSLDNLTAMAKLPKGRNGSEPTALFKEDSFYREVTVQDVEAEVERLKALPKPPKYSVLVRCQGRMYDGKDTCPSSDQDFLQGSFDVRVKGKIDSDTYTAILHEVERFKARLIEVTS